MKVIDKRDDRTLGMAWSEVSAGDVFYARAKVSHYEDIVMVVSLVDGGRMPVVLSTGVPLTTDPDRYTYMPVYAEVTVKWKENA